MTIHELSSVIWLESPKGRALAVLVIDRGPQSDLEWVTFTEAGECWTFLNPDIRLSRNETQGLAMAKKPRSKGSRKRRPPWQPPLRLDEYGFLDGRLWHEVMEPPHQGWDDTPEGASEAPHDEPVPEGTQEEKPRSPW